MDESLHTWATRLTCHHKVFSHDQPITQKHFSCLTLDKDLQPVLSFILRHVRPPEERRHIRLNLKHAHFRKRLKGGEGEMSASEERFKLKAAVLDTSSAVAAEVAEIQQLNHRKEELHQKEVEVRRQRMLLKIAQENRDRETHYCQLWRTQLCNLIQDESSKKKKSCKSDMGLQRQLRGNLLDLEKLHHSIISGPLASPDYIHEQKVCLWEHIGETMDDWDPRILLDGMSSEVREGTRRLQSQVQHVDLPRDAHELRLKCEKDGSFIDEMNPRGVIESVRELLGQMSAAHVKLYVEAHQADQTALSLTRALKALHNNINSVAKRIYCDDTIAAAVVNVVRGNTSLVGERAALNSAQTLAASLQERADSAARARDAVRVKHSQIRSFNKAVQDGVESIQCLAMSVHDGWLSIKNCQDQVKSSIDEMLSCNAYPAPVSPHSLGSECEAFTAVPLAYILTTDTDECRMIQKAKMSTTSLTWYDHEVAEAGWEAVSHLCSGMQCWDGIYDTVSEQLRLTTSFHNQMERLTNVKAGIHSGQKKMQILSSHDMKEIIDCVDESDKKLNEEVTNLTVNLEKQVAKGSQHITKVNMLLSDWWEQPAKFIDMKKNCND